MYLSIIKRFVRCTHCLFLPSHLLSLYDFWLCVFIGSGVEIVFLKKLLLLLGRCFAKIKVIRYTAFFKLHSNYFSEQFYMAASLCISSQKEDRYSGKIACSRSTIQKLDRLWNVYKIYNKDTRASLFDVVLVSLLLTLKIFHILFYYFYYWFWAGNCSMAERFDNSRWQWRATAITAIKKLL